MKENIIALGVVHGALGEFEGTGQYNVLSGKESDKLLARDWFPTFGDKSTLIIAEGKFRKTIQTNEHPEYEELLQTLSLALSESDYGPDILWADVRNRDSRKAKELQEGFLQFDNWVSKYAGINRSVPDSLEKIQDLITKRMISPYEFTFDIPPVGNVKRLAGRCSRAHREMEEYMVSQARKYSDQYDQVLIICGASHALEMNYFSKVPFRILFEPKDEKDLLGFFAGVTKQELTRAILTY